MGLMDNKVSTLQVFFSKNYAPYPFIVWQNFEVLLFPQ